MAAKPKILLLGEIDQSELLYRTESTAHESWTKLSDIADLVTSPARNRAEFIQECKDGKLDGVVAAYRTFQSIEQTGRFDQELCEVLPKSWRWLGHNGAGYDQIDPSACSAREPPLFVANCPGATEDATADTAVFLIIGTLRNFNPSMAGLRRHQWKGIPAPNLGHDPQGKVLGILGMGGIGKNLKKKMEAFGMTCIYHNRRELSPELSGGANYVSFEELLRQSDVLSLNVPLNPNTRHIISTPQFKLMKPSSIIINTARGAVIDEAALVSALNDRLISAAGLDVFEEEPKIHPGLVENERVLLLPHMGTWTSETQTKMEELVIRNIRNAVEGKGLLNPVPEQQDLDSKS
ncbi:MAG: hypothetical protein Q9160_000863 [Pyrenula sp. 1 TL-2023]